MPDYLKEITQQAEQARADVQTQQRQVAGEIATEAEKQRRELTQAGSEIETEAQTQLETARRQETASKRAARELGVTIARPSKEKVKQIEQARVEAAQKVQKGKREVAKAKEVSEKELEKAASEALATISEQEKKAVEEYEEFAADNVELSTGEWIDKASFEELSGKDQDLLKEVGIEAFNKAKEKEAAKAEAEFKDSYIETGKDGEYISKEAYKDLTKEDQSYLKSHSLKEYNNLLEERGYEQYKSLAGNAAISLGEWKARSTSTQQQLLEAYGYLQYKQLAEAGGATPVSQQVWNAASAKSKENIWSLTIKDNYTTLASGELVPNIFYNGLSAEDKQIINEKGIDYFNQYSADRYYGQYKDIATQTGGTVFTREEWDKMKPKSQEFWANNAIAQINYSAYSQLKEANGGKAMPLSNWLSLTDGQRTAKLENEQAEFEDTHIQLRTVGLSVPDEWIDKDTFDSIEDKDEQQYLLDHGIEAWQKKYYIVLNNGELVNKASYSSMSLGEQQRLNQLGTVGYQWEQLQGIIQTANISTSFTSSDWASWSPEERSRAMANILDTYYVGTRTGYVLKTWYNSLSPDKQKEVVQLGITEYINQNYTVLDTGEAVPNDFISSITDDTQRNFLQRNGLDSYYKEYFVTLSTGEIVSKYSYTDKDGNLITGYNDLSAEDQKILSTGGIVNFLSVQQDRIEIQQQAISQLEPYKDKDDNYNISSYLMDNKANPTTAIATLENAGFSKEAIDTSLAQVAAMVTLEPYQYGSQNIEVFKGKYCLADILASGDKQAIAAANVLFSPSDIQKAQEWIDKNWAPKDWGVFDKYIPGTSNITQFWWNITPWHEERGESFGEAVQGILPDWSLAAIGAVAVPAAVEPTPIGEIALAAIATAGFIYGGVKAVTSVKNAGSTIKQFQSDFTREMTYDDIVVIAPKTGTVVTLAEVMPTASISGKTIKDITETIPTLSPSIQDLIETIPVVETTINDITEKVPAKAITARDINEAVKSLPAEIAMPQLPENYDRPVVVIPGIGAVPKSLTYGERVIWGWREAADYILATSNAISAARIAVKTVETHLPDKLLDDALKLHRQAETEQALADIESYLNKQVKLGRLNADVARAYENAYREYLRQKALAEARKKAFEESLIPKTLSGKLTPEILEMYYIVILAKLLGLPRPTKLKGMSLNDYVSDILKIDFAKVDALTRARILQKSAEVIEKALAKGATVSQALASAQALAKNIVKAQSKTATVANTATKITTLPSIAASPMVKTASTIKTASLTNIQSVAQTIANTATRAQTTTQAMVKPAVRVATATVAKTLTQTQTQVKPAAKVATTTAVATKTATKAITKAVTKTAVKTAEATNIITMTPIKIQLPDGSSHRLTKKERAGAVGWKQGFIWIMIFPPYGKNNASYTKKPIPGIPYYKGAGSAYASIVRMGGQLPPEILRDMGIFDIKITTGRAGKPKLSFRRDIKQRTTTTPGVRAVG
jgi:hypothetical protein